MDKSNFFGIIYVATNLINNKKYVGQTMYSLEIRKTQHFSESKKGNPSTTFDMALKKHGKINFVWEIIDSSYTSYELDDLERFWIHNFNTLAKNNKGYNIREGGNGGSKFAGKTEEEMKEYSNKLKEIWKKETPERKQERLQKKRTTELQKSPEEKEKTRLKRSNSVSGEKHHAYGTKNSEEVRLKKSEAHKGIPLSVEHRLSLRKANLGVWLGVKSPCAKSCLCIETGEIFGCTKDGARKIYGNEKFHMQIGKSIKKNKPIKKFSWKWL